MRYKLHPKKFLNRASLFDRRKLDKDGHDQGTLIEGEGSVRLTSLLRYLVL
jgi:hypothetical protein